MWALIKLIHTKRHPWPIDQVATVHHDPHGKYRKFSIIVRYCHLYTIVMVCSETETSCVVIVYWVIKWKVYRKGSTYSARYGQKDRFGFAAGFSL